MTINVETMHGRIIRHLNDLKRLASGTGYMDLVDAVAIVALASKVPATREEVARFCLRHIVEEHCEAQQADALFDGGEFSGPEHSRMMAREVEEFARKFGFSGEQIELDISVIEMEEEWNEKNRNE